MWTVFLFLVFSLTVLVNADSELPGVKLRLTTKGITYASTVGQEILSKEIYNIQIPDVNVDIHDGPGHGNVEAKNIKITGFDSPAFWYKLLPPNQALWGTHGGVVTLRGDWKGAYKVLFWIKGSGSFRVTAKNIDFTIQWTVQRGDEGRPKLNVFSCSANINNLDISISGGFIGWILNLFSGKLEGIVRSQLKSKLCDEAMHFLNIWVNDKLNTLPTVIYLDPNLRLNYTLTQDPIASESYVESYHKGEITWNGQDHASFGPATMPSSSEDSKMLYVWGSDYVMKTLLYVAYKHRQIQFNLTQGMIPDLDQYLATTCSKLCIGVAFPKLKQDFPNKTVSIYFNATNQPEFDIAPNNARITGNISANIYLDKTQSPNKTDINLLTVLIHLDGALTPKIINMSIAGNMTVKNLHLTILESHIGDIPQFALDVLVMLLTPELESIVNNGFLKQGFPIPNIEGVSLVAPVIKLLDHTVEVGTDVHYAAP